LPRGSLGAAPGRVGFERALSPRSKAERAMSRAKISDDPALKIVTQYWHGRVRVCEFERAGARLDLHISQTTDVAGAAGWRVEAHNGRAAAHTFSECASTRSAALSAVASSWTTQASALGLPSFDWDAVAIALRAVHALD
jgi:hypothetical protein